MPLPLLAVAGISYGIGAVLGHFTHAFNAKQQYDYYDNQVDRLKLQAFLDLQARQKEFEIAKKEANKNADESDRVTTVNERLADTSFNNSLESLQSQQELEGLQFNQAAQSIGQSTGNALSRQAASGIRAGGSLSEGIALEAAQNTAQLQAQEKATRQNDELNLSNMLAGLQNTVSGLQTSRTQAQDLRESFESGGSAYESYKNSMQKTLLAYWYDIKDAREKRDANAAWNGSFWVDNFKSALSMGQSVSSAVTSFAQLAQNVAKPTYNTLITSTDGFTSNYTKPFAGFSQPKFSFSNIGGN